MRLTVFSDYSLRALLYLGSHAERLCTVTEIAAAYAISRHHLVKVSQHLIQMGVVESVRGRKGGLRLAQPAARISVGALIRSTEPDLHLVECFDPQADACAISPSCELKDVLREAQGEFLRVLDGYTLADLLQRRRRYVQLWETRLGKQR